MSGYYPEGVTGAELEIAGPHSERETTSEGVCWRDDCALMDEPQQVFGTEWTYDGVIHFDWTCPSCGNEYQNLEEYDPALYHPDL